MPKPASEGVGIALFASVLAVLVAALFVIGDRLAAIVLAVLAIPAILSSRRWRRAGRPDRTSPARDNRSRGMRDGGQADAGRDADGRARSP
jgi:membrane protein implicated in regulation of membrane protease activity